MKSKTNVQNCLISVQFKAKLKKGEKNPCPTKGRCHYIEVFEDGSNRKPSVVYCEHFQGTKFEPSVMDTYLEAMVSKNRQAKGNLTIFCNVKAVMEYQEKDKINNTLKVDKEVIDVVCNSKDGN